MVMKQSQGFLLAGLLFMLAGAIQMFTQGASGGAFIAIGAVFVALFGKAKKSEGEGHE
jgi:hypothetical protein